MTLPPFVWKYIGAGIGGAVLAFSIWGAVSWHASHHYNRGVKDEKAAQTLRDAEVEPVANDLKKEGDAAEDKRDETTREIRTETRTGISEIYLERAIRDAKADGKAIGRAETIAAYRASGGCLAVEFEPTDQLLLDGLDLQRDIFGDVIGGDRTNEADTLRDAPGTVTIPGPAGGYPESTDRQD